ncbi:ECF transporter S component [Clostridium manihotivorum]|uniref:ECF transporter S component n=1 Tax=Clostridium manihotivorum TaxID=2320868 RepID=A0A3R5X5E3_9CLOT|nr:ECF transporter S component [Clostridium manihotivorum]QAA35140.1 ECF transporter S component [Clostridium manihotivorum]
MEKINSNGLSKSALLLAIAIAFQLIGRTIPEINQFLVGPIINAVLLLSVYICGVKWGVLTAALTPILAWVVGQLAAPMAPFIPFIIIGNIIYVILFGSVREKIYGIYIGIILGSFVKFLFLSLSASHLVKLLKLGIPTKVLDKLVLSMGVPQLITALAGGIIAMVLIQILSKRKVI